MLKLICGIIFFIVGDYHAFTLVELKERNLEHNNDA